MHPGRPGPGPDDGPFPRGPRLRPPIPLPAGPVPPGRGRRRCLGRSPADGSPAAGVSPVGLGLHPSASPPMAPRRLPRLLGRRARLPGRRRRPPPGDPDRRVRHGWRAGRPAGHRLRGPTQSPQPVARAGSPPRGGSGDGRVLGRIPKGRGLGPDGPARAAPPGCGHPAIPSLRRTVQSVDRRGHPSPTGGLLGPREGPGDGPPGHGDRGRPSPGRAFSRRRRWSLAGGPPPSGPGPGHRAPCDLPRVRAS